MENKQQRKGLQAFLEMDKDPIIIIDEISNVSPMKLALIDTHLQEIFNNSDQPFGSLAVIVTGDFSQIGTIVANILPKAAINVVEHDNDYQKGLKDVKLVQQAYSSSAQQCKSCAQSKGNKGREK